MKKRLLWVDIAKGICIISVILGHLGIERLGFVYTYHLPVFFILTGYTMKPRPVTPEFALAKFRRLMAPYFITCAAVSAMDIINALIRGNSSVVQLTKIAADDLRRSFFASGTFRQMGGIEFDSVIGAIWFLPAMFFAVLLAALLLSKTDDYRVRFGVSCAGALLSAASAKIIWLPFSIQAGVFACPFIILGFFIRERNITERLTGKHFILSGLVFAVGCALGYGSRFYMVTCFLPDAVFTIPVVLCASMFVIQLSIFAASRPVLLKLCTPLRLAGEASLEIMCIHLFEMNTLGADLGYLLRAVGLPDTLLPKLAVRLCFIAASAALIKKARSRENVLRGTPGPSAGRDDAFDIMRAGMIGLMILGHVSTDQKFREITYSVHMPAFIFISGYFFRPPESSLARALVKHLKSLRIYAVFTALYILIFGMKAPLTYLLRSAAGISNTDKLFSGITSVGPVWFILMLFLIKLIYMFMERVIPSEAGKNAAVLITAAAGYALGKAGLWLPWSADCALFCLLLYRAGVLMRSHAPVEKLKERPYLYFVSAPLWAYLVHTGSLNIAQREYGMAGASFFGSLAGILTVYPACAYLSARLPTFLKKVLCDTGAATGYILVIHTLFGRRLSLFARDVLSLSPEGVYSFVFSLAVQLICGIGVLHIIRCFKRQVLTHNGQQKNRTV